MLKPSLTQCDTPLLPAVIALPTSISSVAIKTRLSTGSESLGPSLNQGSRRSSGELGQIRSDSPSSKALSPRLQLPVSALTRVDGFTISPSTEETNQYSANEEGCSQPGGNDANRPASSGAKDVLAQHDKEDTQMSQQAAPVTAADSTSKSHVIKVPFANLPPKPVPNVLVTSAFSDSGTMKPNRNTIVQKSSEITRKLPLEHQWLANRVTAVSP